MEESLTILTTYGLRGDLEGLPRLYTFIRQLTAHYRGEGVKVCQDDPAPPPGRLMLLDLGDSCAPDVWHCAVSGGRSMIVALDGMGYHAANVSDFFDADSRERMGESTQIKLIDADHPAELDGVWLTVNRTLPPPRPLTILMQPADSTRLTNNVLQLARPEPLHVGAAQLTPMLGTWKLTHTEIHPLPARILPDPTIAGVVEFVTAEARYRQKRDQSN